MYIGAVEVLCVATTTMKKISREETTHNEETAARLNGSTARLPAINVNKKKKEENLFHGSLSLRGQERKRAHFSSTHTLEVFMNFNFS